MVETLISLATLMAGLGTAGLGWHRHRQERLRKARRLHAAKAVAFAVLVGVTVWCIARK